MRHHKKLRTLSPEKQHTGENEANSFDSGVDTSTHSLDSSNHVYSLAGRVESLQMINFMCHSNLEVTFNKRMTFVTGRNGSGKSTIMAALIVVLGGSANTTGRGSGLTDFIKKGERWAKVSVTLINDGINSYKKNIYGNRITVTRDLSVQGGSSYVCRSGFGDVVSKKKEEVDKICTALDIQIKNPICILNQDIARTFLSAADNKTMYSMFMKATHLENLRTIYSNTIELLCASHRELKSKKGIVEEAHKEINQLKEKLEYFASLEKYVNEKTSLENEFLWALVIEEEKRLKELLDKKSVVENKKKELEKSEASLGDVINKIESDIKENQEKISDLGNQDGDKTRKKELQIEIQNFQRELETVDRHMKNLVAKSERQTSDINSIKEHLRQNEEMGSQSQAEKAKIRQQIEKLKSDLSELRDRIETSQKDYDNGLETKLQYKMALEDLKSDVTDLERLKKNKEMLKETNRNAGENNLLRYGAFTPKLRELIDEAAEKNQFLKKPIGPCGMYVTLSGDMKWARAAESVVSGLMGTYCCDNQKDFQVLSRIMERACSGKSPPIIISKFQSSRHNVSSKKASVRGLNTVLDVLHFSNDVVFNTFIDQARLETILLFETDAQASSLLSHIQNVPKNLRMGLTLESDQYYPAPNYRTYFGDSSRALKYFGVPGKGKSVVEKLETEVKETQLRIKEKNMEIAELTNNLVKMTDFLKKAESNLRSLKQNERKIVVQMNQLKMEEESKPIFQARVVLEQELAVLEKNEKEVQEKIETDRKTVEALTKEKEDRVRILDKITKAEKNLQSQISKLQEKLDELKYKLTIEKNKKRNLRGSYEGVKAELESIGEEIRSKNKELKSKTKAATEVNEERIDTDRSPAEVKKLLEKCDKYLAAAERKLDSKEMVINEYKMKYQKYKSIKTEIEILERSVEALRKRAVSKRERFELLKSHTANLVSLHFQACLKTRGYDGQLKFDFENQALELEIIPKDGLVRKDTKTLSGGERSYSMVSFILAIWRAVQMPFYFLDEFDVFMDKVNRKVIMDLLIEHGKNEMKKQFIFITPQDISAVETSDIVSVYKMPDPRKTNQ